MFKLQSSYSPTWDQPKAIETILNGYNNWEKNITLLWATWTGKTFTMANIIKELKRPTLVISHNKTLAAQLATEFKYFFPENAVHYFVSYFDYYQPEAYIAAKDIYIEKESTINKEIEMFRLSTMASLLSREDVIVVSSVSALYGLWTKEEFQRNMLHFEVWKTYKFDDIKRSLIYMQYKPVQGKVEQWMFDFRWEMLDIYSSIDSCIYRLIFNEEELEFIQQKDSNTFNEIWTPKKITIWPASQFLQNMDWIEDIYKQMNEELELRVQELKKQWKELEAQRLFKRVNYDIRMIKETWYTNWIENYSIYFDKRLPGQPPNTIFDYFPDDCLVIVDESHMSLPQLRAMHNWDRSRKISLIENGFRLPSAIDHRPIRFWELEFIMGWWDKDVDKELMKWKDKKSAKTLFVSATPAEYELEISTSVAQQVIRPTGLLDPITYVYPKSWDYELLMKSISQLLKKDWWLKKFLDGYQDSSDLKKILEEVVWEIDW